MTSQHKKVVVTKSKIHGSGVVSIVDIKKGELITFIKGPVKKKINKTIDDVFDNPDWVGRSKFTWIDPMPPCKYLNHSCEPNAGVKGQRSLRALRDIKAGEEITIDYSTIEADTRWQMKCGCKSKKCRKVIRSIQFLQSKYFKDYLPYVPYGLKKIYFNTQ